jgi:diguanylate cyclase (GGDEF)-like protein/PAS domain S-box-containing protein
MSKSAIKRLLLVEDNPGDARLLREMFDERGSGSHITTLTHVESLLEAEKCLSAGEVDIVLLDLGLPDANGLTAVRRAQAAAPRVPVVVLTGLDDEALAAQALNEGAQDYLIKGQIESSGLFRALRYAIERKIMEETLFAEKERAQVTLRCIAEGVICADILGNVTFLNLVAEQATGWSLQEAAGRPMVEVFRTRENAGGDSLETTAEVAIMQIRAMHLPSTCVLIRRDGVAIPIEESIAPIHNREGEAIGAVIVFRDVSAARATALQIAHSAQHDFLTGLPNRMLLNDRIDQAIILARRSKLQVAVLFLDLDGFKHINDSLGHPIGDKLLKSIAVRLVKCVRTTDTVSRQGGDEFVVLLSAVNRPNSAAVTATKILEAIAKPHSIDQHELHVTASIGVSAYPDDGLNAETLIKNADTAMYQMKENGRQGFRFFTPAMNERAVERQSIEESMRRALLRDEFTLYYQPLICLRTRAIVGAEALLRWTHPTRGALCPTQFIAIAEDCGLIVPIGRWVLREACRQARTWITAGYPAIRMAVNVSAMELSEARFLQGVLAILRETGMEPGQLELELTESVLMKRVDSTIAILRTLRDRGVHVAVDDFGTGYSSLSYLRRFPIDTLKVDQSFVRQTGGGGGDAAIVTAVISMARSLKLRVVAEGVETKAELDFLQAHHCDDAQGFYFSKPVPAAEFLKLVTRSMAKLAAPSRVASLATNGHGGAHPDSAESSGGPTRSVGENMTCP